MWVSERRESPKHKGPRKRAQEREGWRKNQSPMGEKEEGGRGQTDRQTDSSGSGGEQGKKD